MCSKAHAKPVSGWRLAFLQEDQQTRLLLTSAQEQARLSAAKLAPALQPKQSKKEPEPRLSILYRHKLFSVKTNWDRFRGLQAKNPDRGLLYLVAGPSALGRCLSGTRPPGHGHFYPSCPVRGRLSTGTSTRPIWHMAAQPRARPLVSRAETCPVWLLPLSALLSRNKHKELASASTYVPFRDLSGET